MSERFDGFKKGNLDQAVEGALADHCEKYGISPLEGVKLFPVLGRRQWLKRFLAHAELFKQVVEVPGDIAELGVFRGMGLMTWANLLEAYCIGNRTKTVWGFDNWQGITELAPEDGAEIPGAEKRIGGFDPSAFKQELLDAIAIFDNDRFIPQKPRIKLVDGPIEETAGRFVSEHPGVRFSLVHFDCDMYKPTRAALEAFWPLLSRGGLMLFDEYAIPDWPGETLAVDEFFTDKQVRIQTLAWNNVPAGYLVKP